MAHRPVQLTTFNDQTLFQQWLEDNKAIMYSKYGSVLKKYGLWLVTTTYTAPACAINAWSSKHKAATVSAKAKAAAIGELEEDLDWTDTMADKDWSHYVGKRGEGVVLFYDGIETKAWDWWLEAINQGIRGRSPSSQGRSPNLGMPVSLSRSMSTAKRPSVTISETPASPEQTTAPRRALSVSSQPSPRRAFLGDGNQASPHHLHPDIIHSSNRTPHPHARANSPYDLIPSPSPSTMYRLAGLPVTKKHRQQTTNVQEQVPINRADAFGPDHRSLSRSSQPRRTHTRRPPTPDSGYADPSSDEFDKRDSLAHAPSRRQIKQVPGEEPERLSVAASSSSGPISRLQDDDRKRDGVLSTTSPSAPPSLRRKHALHVIRAEEQEVVDEEGDMRYEFRSASTTHDPHSRGYARVEARETATRG